MADIDNNLIGKIFNEEAHTFYQLLIKALRESLEQKNIRASDDLINSLKGAVVEASQNAEGKVSLTFADHGRMRDMKKLIYTNQPPVDLIIEWVETIGIDKFKYAPGYNKGKFPSRDIVASRIAWGVSKNLQKKRIVIRTKKQVWYNSPLYTAINNLQNKMAKRYSDLIVQQMINSTK